MLETPHALVGLVIAVSIHNPLVGLPLAFLSHFAVDMIPHWNWEPDSRPLSLAGIALDLIMVEVLTAYLFLQRGHDLTIPAAALAAILPDLIEAPAIFFGHNNLFVKKLMAFQARIQNRVGVLPGIVSQVLIVAVCLLILRS